MDHAHMEHGVQLPAVTLHPCAYVSHSICCRQSCYQREPTIKEIRLNVQFGRSE